jgi:hypothetical protein
MGMDLILFELSVDLLHIVNTHTQPYVSVSLIGYFNGILDLDFQITVANIQAVYFYVPVVCTMLLISAR